MTKQELIEIVLGNIEDLGIDMIETPLDGAPAYINPTRGLGVWDSLRVTPFDLAHEMIHAKYHDESRCYNFDVLNPSERRANREAIEYLWDIFSDDGGSPDYIQNFIDFTGCPSDFAYIIIKKILTA